MRRSGSSSCLLKPKKSLSQHDLAQLQAKAPTASVLTIKRLPQVADRLYILSELTQHAHSIQFLCDLKKSGSNTSSLPPSIILYVRWMHGTYPTPLSFTDGHLSECVRQCLLANGDDAPLDELELVRSHPREPPYSPRRQNFDVLSTQTVESLKQIGPPLIGASSADSSASTKLTHSTETNQDDGSNQHSQHTNIYVVVDRISPDTESGIKSDLPDLSCTSYESIQRGEQNEDSTQTITPNNQLLQPKSTDRKPQSKLLSQEEKELNHHNSEMKMVESLARAIASSRFLRNRIDGLTVGLTSDARAAPGLEACMDTVARGAKERRASSRATGMKQQQGRRAGALGRLREHSPERSPIAIVAVDPDDLESDHDSHHHHHQHHDTDTNNKIFQSRVITEWNGKGDYKTFADRAMSDWRLVWSGTSKADKGTLAAGNHSGKTRPRVPRISRKEVDESDYGEENIDEPVSTAMIIVFLVGILAYIWNLYGDTIHSLLNKKS